MNIERIDDTFFINEQLYIYQTSSFLQDQKKTLNKKLSLDNFSNIEGDFIHMNSYLNNDNMNNIRLLPRMNVNSINSNTRSLNNTTSFASEVLTLENLAQRLLIENHKMEQDDDIDNIKFVSGKNTRNAYDLIHINKLFTNTLNNKTRNGKLRTIDYLNILRDSKSIINLEKKSVNKFNNIERNNIIENNNINSLSSVHGNVAVNTSIHGNDDNNNTNDSSLSTNNAIQSLNTNSRKKARFTYKDPKDL